MRLSPIDRAKQRMGYGVTQPERCCAVCRHAQAQDRIYWSLYCPKGGFGVSKWGLCKQFEARHEQP